MTASEKLVDLLHLQAKTAVVIHDPANMFYLTEGYTGEGLLFLSSVRKVIITDFRYTEAAARQAPGFEVIMSSRDCPAERRVAELCARDQISEILCETNWLSVDALEELRAAVGEEVSFEPLSRIPQTLRRVKTPSEILLMRKAAAVTSEAFEAVLPKIRPGMTERELQIELEFIMYRLGADGLAFSTIIASGEHGSLPHAVPGSRKLAAGDMITMDFGAKVGGYCSDMTRTVALGQPSPEMRRVYSTVQRAQAMCVAALAPKKSCAEVDRLARDYIDSQGYPGRFGHGLGHSLGLEIHEDPKFSAASRDVLAPGMVITVEPGIYLPGVGGVRIEDTLLIREQGAESLTTPTRDLIVL